MPRTMKKAMRLLDLFSLQRPEWGVSEAAKALGFPKSTTSELMSDLADQRLLSRSTKGKYRLGWRLFELSQTLLDTTEFRIEARRVMEDLVECWRETVHLAVLDGVQAVCIEKLEPTPAAKIPITRAGARLPAQCSGVGKILLAHSEWEHVADRLEDQGMPALTSNTITTLDDLALSDLALSDLAFQRMDHLVILVHGRDDGIIPLETSLYLLERLPDVQMHVFGQCRHWIMIEYAAAFNELLEDFLKGDAD
ncbi:MAG: helix-turn-helix domain-containing protein [Actinomycetota bacterium]|nr:helix-turn-helix domain-containing protein [Actinomycetota bacterium]